MSDLAEVADPGHESMRVELHYDGDGLPVKAVIPTESWPSYIRRLAATPAWWWRDYRASLLTRSALSDTLSELERLRLSLELLAVTVAIGLGWTLWVFAVLVLAGIVFGLFI